MVIFNPVKREREFNHLGIWRWIPLLLLLVFLSSCSALRQSRLSPLETLIKEAKSYSGVPYQWGGNNRKGIDCSGLMVNAFRKINIQLPRTTEEQMTVGKKIRLKKIKPGDLVFFALTEKRRKISHVGLVSDVLSGKKVKFIHASVSSGVTESSLDSDYYRKKFRMARRLEIPE